MAEGDREYYRRRAVEERAMAGKSNNRDVAAIHEELARQYEALSEQAELRPAMPTAVTQPVSG